MYYVICIVYTCKNVEMYNVYFAYEMYTRKLNFSRVTNTVDQNMVRTAIQKL